jgi:pimeloyl-ACP methyl ester carboxylesterase
MTSRLTWKPYMYDPALPRLLASVTNPALVIGAGSDEIVPADAVQAYAKALPNATLAVVTGAGHAADLEQPEALSAKVAPFLRS